MTNLGDDFIRSAPDLMDAIEEANAANLKAAKRELPKYVYPDCVVTSAAVGYLCKHHMPWRVKRGSCCFIRKLDAQGANGIFGAGYLLSERAAAERAAATVWELSPRERELQKLLGGREIRRYGRAARFGRATAGGRKRRARKAVFGAFWRVRPEQEADGADGAMATSGRKRRFCRPPL